MTLSHLHHHLLLILVVLFQWNCSVESANPLGVYCSKDTKIESGEASANKYKLVVGLVSKASTDGFLATSYGSEENTVYGLAQCRGDVEKKDCAACIQEAAKQIRTLCPNGADARIWFDYCFLRYNDEDFIGEVDTDVGIYYFNTYNASETERFNEFLGNVVDYISLLAIKPENAGMGKGLQKFTPFITLYALVQCTRDLPPFSCAECLATAVSNIPNFCNNKKGCRVLYSSCYLRYELYPFFFPLASAHAQSFSNTKMTMVYP